MGTVSTTLPSDGQTIDAADVNTPINAILSEFNGNIDNDNIKSAAAISGSKIADASITNAKLSTTAGDIGGAWKDWTPTWGNLTTGNGTLSYAKYNQIGKRVGFKVRFIFGSTTSISGSVTISVPVTMVALTSSDPILSDVTMFDSGTAQYKAGLTFATTTTLNIKAYTADVTYVSLSATGMTSTVPFTWTTGDVIVLNGVYEAA